jgi:hypothetical protein
MPTPIPATPPTVRAFDVSATKQEIEERLSGLIGKTVQIPLILSSPQRDNYRSGEIKDSAGRTYVFEFRRRASYEPPVWDEIQYRFKKIKGREVSFYYVYYGAFSGADALFNELLVFSCATPANTYLAIAKAREIPVPEGGNETAADIAIERMFFDCA